MPNLIAGGTFLLLLGMAVFLFKNRYCMYIGDHWHSEGDK